MYCTLLALCFAVTLDRVHLRGRLCLVPLLLARDMRPRATGISMARRCQGLWGAGPDSEMRRLCSAGHKKPNLGLGHDLAPHGAARGRVISPDLTRAAAAVQGPACHTEHAAWVVPASGCCDISTVKAELGLKRSGPAAENTSRGPLGLAIHPRRVKKPPPGRGHKPIAGRQLTGSCDGTSMPAYRSGSLPEK